MLSGRWDDRLSRADHRHVASLVTNVATREYPIQGRIALVPLTGRHQRAHNCIFAVPRFRPHPPQEAAMTTIVLVHLLSAAA
jgi:hypothetical protein